MSPSAPPAPAGLPRLHVVTDDAVLAARGWLERAVAALEAGGPALALHVRGPTTAGAALHALAAALLPHARRTGALLLVNDRVDVALAVGAGGVHLGRRSLPVAAARGLLGERACLGVSVHDAAGAHGAAREGADYVFLGTIFETPSHPGRSGMGLAALQEVASASGPAFVVGIGGIDERRAGDVVAAGAHGVAVARGVWCAEDAAAAVRGYLRSMENGRSEG